MGDKICSANNKSCLGYKDGECISIENCVHKLDANDGVYMELFVIKNGIKYTAKTINVKEVSSILTNSLMDGIEKLWK